MPADDLLLHRVRPCVKKMAPTKKVRAVPHKADEKKLLNLVYNGFWEKHDKLRISPYLFFAEGFSHRNTGFAGQITGQVTGQAKHSPQTSVAIFVPVSFPTERPRDCDIVEPDGSYQHLDAR